MDATERRARIDRLRSTRLVPGEAARVIATAALALVTLIPSAARLVPAGASATPVADCAHHAARLEATGPVVCDGAGTPLSGPRSFLMGVPIDLDTADAQTLALVPGIGPKLSARIIADRTSNGPFGSAAALQRVKGIGPKLSARAAAFTRR